jgi:hypothetical protein
MLLHWSIPEIHIMEAEGRVQVRLVLYLSNRRHGQTLSSISGQAELIAKYILELGPVRKCRGPTSTHRIENLLYLLPTLYTVLPDRARDRAGSEFYFITPLWGGV